ncbi:MAG: hypothetical protein HN919_20615 [Verrucomicrobia bacterium]|jgi:hypothetical protein|nr:hypothetical protein [Verrucomicrobiota bacterium]MBT7068709.1 hypothetical protein [Verrucomicrobiota bacterium]MBT7701001.1 hypothetical protein [Verrucomicrobiota bacterium]
MHTSSRFLIVSLLTALVLGVGLTGCDENGDVLPGNVIVLAITPSDAAVNQWVHAEQAPLNLDVSGGAAPFTWSLSDDTLGALNNNDDPYARFALYTPAAGKEGLNIVQVIDSNGWQAHTRITQESFALAVAGAPAATPNLFTLTQTNQQVQITVTGGQLPLNWQVNDSRLGEMHPSPARVATYDRVGATAGINTVTVTDAQGLRATATLIQ